MSTRRGFLASILAAGFAPAAIGSGVLMPVRKIVTRRGWETLDGSNEEGWILRRQWISPEEAAEMFPDKVWQGTFRTFSPADFDGEQWTADQRALLQSSHAKPMTFNRMLSHAEARAVIARDVANGCGIVTIG